MLALLACLRGTICLYQGEELGLTEADVPFERLQDPYGKRFWPRFKGRDGCRTPMPWNAGPHAGFSSGEPWLPMPPEHVALNVAAQEADPDSVLNFARLVFALRRARPELHAGALAFNATADETARGLLGFERQADGATLVCLFNLGDEALSVAALAPERTLLSGGLRQTPAHTVLERNGFVIAERVR